MDPIFVPIAAAAILKLPEHRLDRGEPRDARVLRASQVAQAFVAAAHNRTELAALIADANFESHFARLVFEGHCDEMPPGERCDNGHARGVLEVHDWCKAAWEHPAGSLESLGAEAECAVRQMRHGARVCREHALTPLHGAFAALAAAPCSWSGAERRVRLTQRIEAELARLEASAGP